MRKGAGPSSLRARLLPLPPARLQGRAQHPIFLADHGGPATDLEIPSHVHLRVVIPRARRPICPVLQERKRPRIRVLSARTIAQGLLRSIDLMDESLN